MSNKENKNLKGEDDSPSAAAGSETKPCEHTVAIIYFDYEGGSLRTADNLEKSSCGDIDKFNYCPDCGEKL